MQKPDKIAAGFRAATPNARETCLLRAAAAQRKYNTSLRCASGMLYLRCADAAQIRGDVGLVAPYGNFERSVAVSAVQGVSEKRMRAGVRCTCPSRRRLRRAARETGRFQRDHFQKKHEEGSIHYKNRRLKKGENTTRITRAFQKRLRAVELLI
jgi:hypothetical protein